MKGLVKKVVTGLLVFSVISSIFTGCAPKTGGSKDANSAPADSGAAPEKITLTFANHQLAESAGTEATIKKMVDLYLKINKMNVEKIDVINPGKEFQAYYQTQFMGGTQPDIGSGLVGSIFEYFGNKSVIDFSTYLKKPQPYVEDGKQTWENSLAEGILIQVATPDKKQPMMPYAIGANKLAYNPDILKKYNIKPPETWAEFMAACETLKKNGVMPIAYAAKVNGNLHWPMRAIMDSLTEKEMEKIDTDKSYFVDLAETVAAIDKGIIDLSKEPWLSTFTVLSKYTDYWYPGATALSNDDTIEKFAKGETAFLHCAVWMIKTLWTNPERKFEPVMVKMPKLTKETSQYADDEFHNLGGLPNANLWISSTLKGKKLDAAVDFVMFLTGTECAKILADEMWMIPTIAPKYMPKTQGPLGQFGLDYKISRSTLFDMQMGKEFFDDIFMKTQPLVTRKATPEQTGAALQAQLKAAANKVKTTNNWSAENDYGRKK